MNPKGNKTIGKTKKYSKEQRREITKLIKTEWAKVKANNPSSEEFASQVQHTLSAVGIKSPQGGALSLRGVKYQVQRSGIKFKGRLGRRNAPSNVVSNPRPTVPATSVYKESEADRAEIVQTLGGIPKALRGILEDDQISGKQRVAMFSAWFELEPKL